MRKNQEQNLIISIAATFTAEPVEEILLFWMEELKISSIIEFAPYNQIFQQLLDPLSLLSQNQNGINIILLRFEDWYRFDDTGEAKADSSEKIERNVQELVMALKSATARSAAPYLVGLCPASPGARDNVNHMALFQKMEDLMVSELSGIGSLYLMISRDLATYPVEDYYDPQKDKLGHIPFTPIFFTALGTALARRIYAIRSTPHKVIVLDCDNTLWKGIVGEDGVMGIEIAGGWQALQEFMVAQQNAGMLICLCSKNNEPDVIEVFEKRPEMLLKRENIVSWRINWLPKSENIKSLAQELNLGLDSFIFIDDNPVECAEVQASCPEVLTLQLPIDGDISRFVNHVWAFDHLKVTQEDKQRTSLYKQNIERDRFAKEVPTIQNFLAGLALKVEISEPSPCQLSRVSQLTQRTNQFNFTTVRRSEGEIQQLSQSALECRIVEVNDRFGEYGLVGVMIFEIGAEALTIDTFLLSCRVLGRGVEHRMLAHLAEIAKEHNLAWVDVSYIHTQKNLPALDFLESVAADFKQPIDKGFRFSIPVEFAAAISYTPGTSEPQPTRNASIKAVVAKDAVPSQLGKSAHLNRIATELYDAEQIFNLIASQQRLTRSQLQQPLVAARTETEKQLVRLWSQLLHIEMIGIQDNYFELGGTSILAVELFAEIEKTFSKNLPLTTLLEAPTIEQLAVLLQQEESTTPAPLLVAIQTGGSKPPLFCPQGAGGNVLCYRELASYLGSDQPVYGLQAKGLDGKEEPYTCLKEMAADYIRQIRTVQPEGPYFLAGLSFGGIVAFEMAQQLHAQGEKVVFVGMFDTYRPGYPRLLPPIPRLVSTLGYTLHRFLQLEPKEKLALVLKKARISKKSTNKSISIQKSKATVQQAEVKQPSNGTKSVARKLNYVDKLNALSFSILKSSPWAFLVEWHIPGIAKPLPPLLQKVQESNGKAGQAYIPTVYPGQVTLFRCSNKIPGHYYEPDLGWGGLATGGVQIVEVPGSHHSLLMEPHVRTLAEQLRVCLDRAQANALAANHQPNDKASCRKNLADSTVGSL